MSTAALEISYYHIPRKVVHLVSATFARFTKRAVEHRFSAILK